MNIWVMGSDLSKQVLISSGGTGIRELTRGLATLPKRWFQEPLVVRDGWKTPKRTPWQCTAATCVAGVHR